MTSDTKSLVAQLTAKVASLEGELKATKAERDRLIDDLKVAQDTARDADIRAAIAESKLEELSMNYFTQTSKEGGVNRLGSSGGDDAQSRAPETETRSKSKKSVFGNSFFSVASVREYLVFGLASFLGIFGVSMLIDVYVDNVNLTPSEIFQNVLLAAFITIIPILMLAFAKFVDNRWGETYGFYVLAIFLYSGIFVLARYSGIEKVKSNEVGLFFMAGSVFFLSLILIIYLIPVLRKSEDHRRSYVIGIVLLIAVIFLVVSTYDNLFGLGAIPDLLQAGVFMIGMVTLFSGVQIPVGG